MRKTRLYGVGAGFALATLIALAPGCGAKKSGIMLAVTTDMKAPKDVNAVSVTISTNNTVKHNVVGRVTPQGDILLPATLAVVQPDDPAASIRIRVMAFQERRARVLRDVRTSIPAGGRIALMRIPLNFVNDGSVLGDLPDGILPTPNPGTAQMTPLPDAGKDGGASNGASSSSSAGNADLFDPFTFVPNCPNPEHTWIDGECKDAFVDPDTLPEFEEELVGAGDDPGVCFDVKKCFGEAKVIGQVTEAGGACSLTMSGAADGAKVNVALVTRDTGECIFENECYVPLDSGEGGFTVEGNSIKLPASACKLVQNKDKRVTVAYSTNCDAKKVTNPLCAVTKVTSEPPPPKRPGSDAGNDVPDATEMDAGNDSGPQPVAGLLVPEELASSVMIAGSTLYMAGANRIAEVDIASFPPQGSPISGIPASEAPWSFGGGVAGGFTLTNGTTEVYLHTASGTTVLSLPAGAEGSASFYAALRDRYFVGALGSGAGLYSMSGTDPDAGLTTSIYQIGGGEGGQLTEARSLSLSQSAFQFLVGTSDGKFALCDTAQSTCGFMQTLGTGTVDALLYEPVTHMTGYALVAGSGVYRITSIDGFGNFDILKVSGDDVMGFSSGGKYYPHGLAANAACVFYTTNTGVAWVTADGAQGGVIQATNESKPFLGIGIGPKSGGSQSELALYYSMFASMADGGGVYMADIPKECTGAAPQQDAGAADSSTSLDAGVGPDVSCVPQTCAQLNANCGFLKTCGNDLFCGTCSAGETCGGAGTPFQCGVPPVDGGTDGAADASADSGAQMDAGGPADSGQACMPNMGDDCSLMPCCQGPPLFLVCSPQFLPDGGMGPSKCQGG